MSFTRPLLVFVVCIFFIGYTFGALATLMMPKDQKEELADDISFFFDGTDQVNRNQNTNIWGTITRYLLIGLFISLIGASVIGVPFVLLYLFIKGTILGFTSTFFMYSMGKDGILFILYTVLPQNLLLVPTLIFFTAGCISFAFFIIKNRLMRFQGKLLPVFTSYLTLALGTIATLVIVNLYESIILPIIINRF